LLRGEEPYRSLWKTPVDGGGNTIQVLDSVYAAHDAVVKDGIYFVANAVKKGKSDGNHPEDGTVRFSGVS